MIEVASELGVRVYYGSQLLGCPPHMWQAARVLASDMRVHMFDTYCFGGRHMLQAIMRAAQLAMVGGDRRKVLGIPVPGLMSHEALAELGFVPSYDRGQVQLERLQQEDLRLLIARLAHMGQECGLDGVVVPPHDITNLRALCGDKFIIVWRDEALAGAAPLDRPAMLSLPDAVIAGADYVVVGHPLTHPRERTRIAAATQLVEEIGSVL